MAAGVSAGIAAAAGVAAPAAVPEARTGRLPSAARLSVKSPTTSSIDAPSKEDHEEEELDEEDVLDASAESLFKVLEL